jgi:hypothetical protein
MFDFIKDVRYDIFLVYSGLILIAGISWLYYTYHPDFFKIITDKPEFMLVYIIITWMGLYIFYLGLSEFKENYIKEKEINELRREVERLELEKKKTDLQIVSNKKLIKIRHLNNS